MRVLGLGTGVDSGAALVEDGRLLAAVNEERLARLKLVEGFPRASIEAVLGLAGVAPHELDAVLVGSTEEPWADELRAFPGWFEEPPHGLVGWLKRSAGVFSRYQDRLPVLERAYYALQAPSFRERRRGVRRVLREEFGITCPVRFVDHHLAHVTSACYTSGFEEALVLSVDGGGDRKSALVCAAKNGDVTPLHEVSAFDSLGNYYAYITKLCGFRAQKHEGKITGLAAHGEPRYVPLLKRFIEESNGTFVNRGGVVFHAAIRALERRLPPGWKTEDLAASVQRHFEDVMSRFARHWAESTGLRDLALAGGVFANVRVNQEVHRLSCVDRVFVHPGMTDGGLPVGAALAACLPGVLEERMAWNPAPLEHVYLGPGIEDGEIEAALRAFDLSPEPLEEDLEERIADLLAEGHVVARAAGRMEYGPRALGNRSILYEPTDPRVNDWLNERLGRTEFMPFAPAILFEERARCFVDTEGAERAAEFMTITFECTEWMKGNMTGTVHLDGTARPQLVRREANPSYYRILEAFRRRTGLPGLINTSFNMHEEPIVCTAEDCVRAFLDGGIDYLALGPVLVRNPKRESGEPARARRREPGRRGERRRVLRAAGN